MFRIPITEEIGPQTAIALRDPGEVWIEDYIK
jgi:hypothetical protein